MCALNPEDEGLAESLRSTWAVCNRLTLYLVEQLPPEIWPMSVPGAPRRTVRSICAHLHNCRCMWIRSAGPAVKVRPPSDVDRSRAAPNEVLSALERSGDRLGEILDRSLARGGDVARFPLDVLHFLAYHAAHEGHHRGQLCLIARQLGRRLPQDAQAGLWKWPHRLREAQGQRRGRRPRACATKRKGRA